MPQTPHFQPPASPQTDFTLQSRAIRIINIFRFVLSGLLVLFYLYLGQTNWLETQYSQLFFNLTVAYAVFGAFVLTASLIRFSAVIFFHPAQIVIDIVFIILLMFAAGGIQSGFGLLLIITIVTASLVSNGRLALFYAAIATIGLLLEQTYRIARNDFGVSSYTQSVLLSMSCFATAWLAYSLAKRMSQSEALATSRGVDLANLSQVNELITQEMQDGVIVVDENMQIRHHNMQVIHLLALNHAIDSHMPLKQLCAEIATPYLMWMNSEDYNSELVVTRQQRELKLRFKPIDHTNRQQGSVIFIQDWSQLQLSSQQAKLAALGRLTANIAHEIRNPLSAISHANQLLLEEEGSPPTQTRMLQIVADNIQRIEQIIRDVLELNRRDRTQQEEIALNRFIIEFHAQFCAVEKIQAADFQLHLCDESTLVLFDHRHLTQILWNLCRNGWEHGQKQSGSLRLACSSMHKSGLEIIVTDDGIGIPEQDRAKLFEPFYTTKQTGNGLGLYISRELAEANGAQLSYQPRDAGSAFILQFKNTSKKSK